ncbi:hypothetical protein ACFJIX_05530 [Roseateles sp. UC29_93]|uniref:COG4648 family protein n=1 Tax=Roseateles sp. UC29_93 TaxID=3350177 RepID=UPI00366F32C5
MARAVLWLLTAAYPLLVYLGLAHAQPRDLALLLAALAALRALARRGSAEARLWWWSAAGAALLAGAAALMNQSLPLKLYPVLVNAGLLGLFGVSLWHGPPIVERLARLTEPDLDERGQRYTRRVTQVWCGFFVMNGGIALATALWADDKVWALYNGLVSYVLIGLLMGGEYLMRLWVRRRDAVQT